MNRYEQETPQVQPPANYSDRMGLHTTDAGVKVPLEQSIVTGVLFAFTLGAVLLILSINLVSVIKWMGVTVLLVATVHWVNLHRHWWRLTKLENFLGVELDGIPNKPTPAIVQYTVNTFSQEGHMTGQHQYTFTATPEQIRAFCHKTRKLNFPLARRPWVNQGTFTDDSWRVFYRELVTQNLVTAVKGRNVLTEEGEQWADGVIAEDDPHYSPTEDAIPAGGK